MYAGLTRDIRVTDPLDNHDKVFGQIPIQEILDQQASAKSCNHRKNLEIFYLDQLLYNDNSELITWQQLKKAQLESAKGKKARQKIQQTVRPPLFEHKKDKQNKDWIIFEDQKNLLLRKKCVESLSEHKLIDLIEIAEMEIELINGLNLEKETKDMLSSM
ncbi:35899_t:CDS:2, partial [Gigaspora margarita]